VGHIAFDYYNRFNQAYPRDLSKDQFNQPLHTYYTTPSGGMDLAWYPDSGATYHLTSNIDNLNLTADEYKGSDQIRVGNGNGLSIKNIGNTRLFTSSQNFDLFNVLHVPTISKNLISVHKFTKDTNTFFEFHPYYFLLKDRKSGKILLHDPNKHGLYQFPNSTNKLPAFVHVGGRVSTSQWHSRLGHPALRVVRRVLSNFRLPIASKKEMSPCPACLSSKSKQLIFQASHSTATI
jgi:hypothetical protein